MGSVSNNNEEILLKDLEEYRELAQTDPATYEPYVAMALNRLGLFYKNANEYDRAAREYTEALAIHRKLAEADPTTFNSFVAMTLNNLGTLYYNMGDFDRAVKDHEESLEIFRRLAIDDPAEYDSRVAAVLSSMGLIHHHMNDYDQAVMEYGEALDIFRRLDGNDLNTRERLANTLNHLGNLHYLANNNGQAEKSYSESLAILRELAASNPSRFTPLVALLLRNLGNLHRRTNDYDKAMKEYEDARILYSEMPNSKVYLTMIAGLLTAQGSLYEEKGEYKKALEKFDEGIAVLEQTTDPNDSDLSENTATDQVNQIRELRSKLITEQNARELEQSLGDNKSIQIRLNQLSVKNLRLYGDAEQHIDFDRNKNITILLGDNGAGKTTLQYACDVLMSNYLTGFYPDSVKSFDEGDVRLVNSEKRADYLAASLSISLNELERSVSLYRKGEKEAPESDVQLLRSLSNVVRHKLADGAVIALPIIAYYGTERGHIEPMKEQDDRNKTFPRWRCYEDALEATTNFDHLFNWFKRMEDEELREQRDRKDLNYQMPALQAVRTALDGLDLHMKNPKVEGSPLRFVMDDNSNPENPKEIRIDQMSDGYRIMIAMIADIAARMAEANPSSERSGLEDPLQTSGVIFIDEVDLHLHPIWQRKVLHQLHNIFPNVQFIVTTHSPNVVIGAIDIAQVVRLDNGVIDTDLYLEKFKYDDISRLLLGELFGLDSVRSPQYAEDSKRRNELIDKDHLTSEEKDELDRLDKEMDKYDPSGVDDIKSILNILGKRE